MTQEPLNKDQLDLAILKNNEIERGKGDSAYAKKIVEYIVFAVMAAAATRVIYGSFDIVSKSLFPQKQETISVPVPPITVVPLPSTNTSTK